MKASQRLALTEAREQYLIDVINHLLDHRQENGGMRCTCDPPQVPDGVRLVEYKGKVYLHDPFNEMEGEDDGPTNE